MSGIYYLFCGIYYAGLIWDDPRCHAFVLYIDEGLTGLPKGFLYGVFFLGGLCILYQEFVRDSA
jgi:hypothetical protein